MTWTHKNRSRERRSIGYRLYEPETKSAPPPPFSLSPSQMGLDSGPPLPGTTTPWGRCYLDGVSHATAIPREEVGVASHSLPESLASVQEGGGLIRVLCGVPLSTSGQVHGISAP